MHTGRVYISTVRRLLLLAALSVPLLFSNFSARSALHAQSLPTLRPEDSGRWESLVLSDTRLGLSPDGSVIAYRVDRSDWDDELRITRRADGKTLVVPFGREPEYSADGRWLMYTIGRSQKDEDQLKRDRRPVHDSLGLLQLATWTETRVADVEHAAFSNDSAFLAIEHYVTRGSAAGRGGGRRASEPTLAVSVRTLATGSETAFDNVQEFSWQPTGHRLAMAMGGDAQGASRLQLVDAGAPTSAGVIVLDRTPASFSRVTWRPNGVDLAYLRSHARNGVRGLSFDLVVVRDAGTTGRALTTYDATRDTAFPPQARLTSDRALTWSGDGTTVFVGIADGDEPAAPDDADHTAVRVWHWRDVEVMPRQVENAEKDRRRSRLAAVAISDARLVPLTLSLDARAVPLGRTRLALVADWSRTALARTFGRFSAELSIVDTHTGARTVFATDVDDATVHVRPDGGAVTFLRGDHLWSLDTATAETTDLSAATGAAFVDLTADSTAPHKPLFGLGGWTTAGDALVYDRADIWRVPVRGTGARALTNGAGAALRHRLADIAGDADNAVIDLARPVYLELFAERTKQFGVARLMPGGTVERLLFEDRRVDNVTTSADGTAYAFVRQAFDQSPNIFVGGPTLADARAVTATNPQQSRYAWGSSTLISYTTPQGETLNAALYYPAGYAAGRRYPTIVKVYEQMSDEVHDYVAPSDMDEANVSIFTQLGYVVLAPDIRYRPRDPGLSAVDCVSAAVARVIALGVTDAARVGVIGHSWGAYESAFLATHTRSLFSAAVAGSAITDLISQAGNHHWSTGVAETDHIETGQQRMQVPFYEDVDAYVRNSPIFGVATMTTPLLLEAGDQDGEVFWHQSVELYNAARRAGKPVVLLQYPDEDHALEDFDNRRDYQRRILQWFGHFLKSETAPPWITTGTPFIKR